MSWVSCRKDVLQLSCCSLPWNVLGLAQPPQLWRNGERQKKVRFRGKSWRNLKEKCRCVCCFWWRFFPMKVYQRLVLRKVMHLPFEVVGGIWSDPYETILCMLWEENHQPRFGRILVTLDSSTRVVYGRFMCRLSLSLSVSLSIYLSVCLSIYLSIHPSIHPSIYLSIYPSIHPSIYLSIYQPLSIYPPSAFLAKDMTIPPMSPSQWFFVGGLTAMETPHLLCKEMLGWK